MNLEPKFYQAPVEEEGGTGEKEEGEEGEQTLREWKGGYALVDPALLTTSASGFTEGGGKHNELMVPLGLMFSVPRSQEIEYQQNKDNGKYMAAKVIDDERFDELLALVSHKYNSNSTTMKRNTKRQRKPLTMAIKRKTRKQK